MNLLWGLLNQVVTIYTVPTAIPVQAERFPLVYTGILKAIDPETDTLAIENNFYGKPVLTIFRWSQVINVCQEPNVDPHSKEFKEIEKQVSSMAAKEKRRLVDELMPQVMAEAKKTAIAAIKAEHGIELKSVD